MMMDRCRAQSPGTDYSLQASLMVTVTGVAAMVGGLFTDQFGYAASSPRQRCSRCWRCCPPSCSSARPGAAVDMRCLELRLYGECNMELVTTAARPDHRPDRLATPGCPAGAAARSGTARGRARS